MVFLVSIILTGCGTTGATSRQLARVAKDWCLTIRASQVIPVYPLTEDVQPGDVFLVRTSIDEQISVYEHNGFLPLENLLVRLQPDDYASFYMGSFGIGAHTNTPHHWQFPDDASQTNGWEDAPRAAFPSYTFSVNRGAGMSLAVPVQGVPIGLSLMGASQAHGSIELTDAYTYGLEMQRLHQRVLVWAGRRTNRDYLSQFGPYDNKTNYLRIIDRVYLVKQVNVSVINDDAWGASVSGGAPKPVDLLKLESGDGVSNYVQVLNALSQGVDTALPGGTLKLAAASGRSVTMTETFPRPLVIGYIAFDLPIIGDGDLGVPIRTHSRLAKAQVQQAHQHVLTSYYLVERIIRYVDPEQTGKVDTAKLTELAKGTTLSTNWVQSFVGKDIGILKNDLLGDDYEFINGLSKNLPAS